MSCVGIIIVRASINLVLNKNLLENQLLERLWTVLPALILIKIAIPSLLLLYLCDEAAFSGLTLKAMGHQWYWRYEYSDLWGLSKPFEFDSYLDVAKQGGWLPFRLLDVDSRAVLPSYTDSRVLVASGDVLHSWTMPTIGIKADATPGRLNQVKITGTRPGVFYGQCSEICGANHRFMPIVLEIIPATRFIKWLFSSAGV